MPLEPDWADRKLTGKMLVEGAATGAGGSAAQGGGASSVGGTGSGSARPSGEALGAAATDASKRDSAAFSALTHPSRLGALAEKGLADLLQPSVTKAVQAEVLPNRNFVIAKGASLDCALETAIDSTVPGITTCRLTRDVYSDNGKVVLLDRGSQLVGQYQGGIRQGQVRIFVLWTRAKTPKGVVVSLDSPGADLLGRSGHDGYVDTHFFERFGAAFMLSLVKEAFLYGQSRMNDNLTTGTNNSATNVYVPGSSFAGSGLDQMAVETLRNSINIPPTLRINQGAHLQVMVARDLDFSKVYGIALLP